MKFELKEKVNVESLAFKKRVIGEAIELLGKGRNYTNTDIEFATMIAFLNNLCVNNVVIDALYDNDKVEEKIVKDVEPMFKEEVLDKEDRKLAYNDIIKQIKEYMDREVINRRSISGTIYDILEELGSLSVEDLLKTVMSFADIFTELVDKPKQEKRDEEAREKAVAEIDNLKMKALIEKFMKQEKEENTSKEA